MTTHSIRGGGGVRLHVEEHGRPDGMPILFIHGFSQCRLAWARQTRSHLADTFRLVTFDLRGHGDSEKPPDAYGDSALWAADVHALINGIGLDAPVLVGWSYGGVIISDYIREYGAAQIAGVQLVGAISRLGEPLLGGQFLDADFLALAPGLFSNDVVESVAALERLLRLCMQGELAPEEFYCLLGYNAAVPPAVRQGMFSRNVDNDPVFASLRTPVSLVYGEADRIVSPRMGVHLEALIPHASVSGYADTGHAPFWDNPNRFNDELREFVLGCGSQKSGVRSQEVGDRR